MPPLTIEFTNVPEGRWETMGPFEWVEMSYKELKAKRSGSDEAEIIAVLGTFGVWETEHSYWTDFVISSAEES